MVQVAVGPGLGIELVNGVPTLTVQVPAALPPANPPEIVERVLTRDANGNYACPKCRRVYRNGIRQAKDVDYRISPIFVLPIQPWAADDVVLGEWVEVGPQPPVAFNPRAIPCSVVWRAPGCCTDQSQILDCPRFYHLLPPQFKELQQAGVTVNQIEQASAAAEAIVQFRAGIQGFSTRKFGPASSMEMPDGTGERRSLHLAP